jgi:hypothetical protein
LGTSVALRAPYKIGNTNECPNNTHNDEMNLTPSNTLNAFNILLCEYDDDIVNIFVRLLLILNASNALIANTVDIQHIVSNKRIILNDIIEPTLKSVRSECKVLSGLITVNVGVVLSDNVLLIKELMCCKECAMYVSVHSLNTHIPRDWESAPKDKEIM